MSAKILCICDVCGGQAVNEGTEKFKGWKYMSWTFSDFDKGTGQPVSGDPLLVCDKCHKGYMRDNEAEIRMANGLFTTLTKYIKKVVDKKSGVKKELEKQHYARLPEQSM